MKLRALLPCAFIAASLTASASFPLQFRDGNNMAPDGGGHMDFPVVDGTKTDTYYGDPLFNEDGSITLTTNSGATGGAAYFRTVKLTEECPGDYTVLAFEYKTNRPINNLVIWKHEIANTHNIINGALMTVSDEYQTLYAPIDRNEGWGKPKHYFWINTNDPNKAEGWELTVKNIRLLTLTEAAAESGAATGDIADAFTLPNADFSRDVDADMDGNDIYVRSGDNPLLATSQFIKTLPGTATTFAFDYKLTGHDVTPAIHLVKDGLPKKTVKPATLTGLGDADPYEAEWKTVKFDLADAIKEVDFASSFGSMDYLWLQFLELDKDGQMMWIKNPRWINTAETSAIEDITIAPERPADDRIFNIMGVECKAPLAPGIYIQNGKKFIVK